MKDITIKTSTLEYALHIVDMQYDHIRSAGGKAAQEKQRSYFNGMRTMLELLITQGYEDKNVMLYTDCYCNHSIVEVGENEVFPRSCIPG